MDKQKKARLEAAGWAVGTAKDFLKLSDAEAAYVEVKVALGEQLRIARTELRLSQQEVAKRVQSSQSRVAKMEAADPSVTVDLIFRSLFQLGESVNKIGRALSTRKYVDHIQNAVVSKSVVRAVGTKNVAKTASGPRPTKRTSSRTYARRDGTRAQS